MSDDLDRERCHFLFNDILKVREELECDGEVSPLALLDLAGFLVGELIKPALYELGCNIEEEFGHPVVATSLTHFNDDGYFTYGGDGPFASPELHARMKRRMLRELIRSIFGHATPNLAREAVNALEALDFGEAPAHSLFAPRLIQGLQGLKEWKLRLRACEHVAFRQGRGKKAEEARDVVAAAFGHGVLPDTLETWRKKSLKKHFPAEFVRASIKAAKNQGKRYHSLKHKRDKLPESTARVFRAPDGKWNEPLVAMMLQLWDDEFGDAALKRDGKAFDNARRSGKKRDKRQPTLSLVKGRH